MAKRLCDGRSTAEVIRQGLSEQRMGSENCAAVKRRRQGQETQDMICINFVKLYLYSGAIYTNKSLKRKSFDHFLGSLTHKSQKKS